jgi:hypothetical protein
VLFVGQLPKLLEWVHSMFNIEIADKV